MSAGRDGNILVWNLAECVRHSNKKRIPGEPVDSGGGDPTPKWTWSEHKLPITDVYVGQGDWTKTTCRTWSLSFCYCSPGKRTRVFSVSFDQTCKIHCIATGKMLLEIVVGKPLTAITVDAFESCLYMGTKTGEIVPFNLTSPPRDLR